MNNPIKANVLIYEIADIKMRKGKRRDKNTQTKELELN